MPRDSAAVVEALETDLLFKEGEGLPRGSFAESLKVFQANRSILKPLSTAGCVMFESLKLQLYRGLSSIVWGRRVEKGGNAACLHWGADYPAGGAMAEASTPASTWLVAPSAPAWAER